MTATRKAKTAAVDLTAAKRKAEPTAGGADGSRARAKRKPEPTAGGRTTAKRGADAAISARRSLDRKAEPAAIAKSHGESGSEIAGILAAIKRFRDARDWKQYHDPKNLAVCLSVEAAELLEVFLWKSHEEIDPGRLAEELADVFYAAFLLADAYGLDVGKIVRAKLKKNAAKYPVAKAKGSRKKYDEL